MRETVRTALHEHYGALVRLAYLALDGGGTPDALLLRARRAVRRSARDVRLSAGDPYPALRRSLAATLLDGPPPPRLRVHRLLFEGAPSAPGPTRTALRKLSPHERLVYVLHRLEGLTAPEVGGELGEHLRVEARDVDRTAAAMDDATGLDGPSQRAELHAFDPALVRLRPPPALPRVWRGALAAALAVILVGGVLGYRNLQDAKTAASPLIVDTGAWQRTNSPTLEHWPTLGGLRGDPPLLQRAAAAWRKNRRDPPVGRMVVLYAGRVDGASVVVLRDSPGYRDSPMVAQYFERPLSRGVESLYRIGTSAGRMIMLGSTWRYLMPPWLTDLRAALPAETRPRWRPISISDGLTEALPWGWYTPHCQNYLVFSMNHRPATGGFPRQVLQLASHNPRSAAPRLWFRDNVMDEDRFPWAILHAAACESAVSLTDIGDLRVGRLWSGGLPDGGGRATLVTIDVAAPWGTPGTALLIDDDGRALSERGGTNGDYTSSGETMAAAVWWRSPRRWHLVAAAGPGVRLVSTIGDLGEHESRGPRHVLMVPGPAVHGPGPHTTRGLPVVQVVTHEPDGDRTLLSPA